MSTLRNTMTTAAALLLVASVAGAQETRRRESIPVDQLPPAGMCRVWIEGLAVNRQPAATDCNTARRNAPANSRIVYGSSSNGRVFLLPRTADPRYDERFDRNGRELSKEERKRLKELEKAERKREKELEKIQRERNKAWEKSHRSDRRRDNDDRDDDRRNRTVDDRSPRDDGRFTQVPRIFRP